jgi:DNA-directed RNA polymerase subunit beta
VFERDVHSSHYGRLCAIETPEGPNIGLISSLSLFAMVDNYGFLVTPYRTVKKGKITNEVAYVRADEEYNCIFAPADSNVDEKGFLITDDNGMVMSRHHGDFALLPRNEIQYLDVDPAQILGISASLIPNLKHKVTTTTTTSTTTTTTTTSTTTA